MAMRVRWSYWLGGLGIAVVSLVVGLEIEMATARPGGVSTTIDRSFKGDRLAPDMHPSMQPRVAPAGQQKLMDGCESSASTIRNSPVAGRCFAAASMRSLA